jgi:quercetin dioxygenase-like cupin family protein
MDLHTLPYGTQFTLCAENYNDITSLGGEVEFWIGGEKHILHKNFGAYIPPHVEQGPLIVRNLTHKVFFNMAQPCGAGIEKYRGGK